MKFPLSKAERHLLHSLFDPRRTAENFPGDAAEANRLFRALGDHGEVDLPRKDLQGLARLLGTYLHQLAGAGAAVPAGAPLDETVALAGHAPLLEHIHAQLLRHLHATE